MMLLEAAPAVNMAQSWLPYNHPSTKVDGKCTFLMADRSIKENHCTAPATLYKKQLIMDLLKWQQTRSSERAFMSRQYDAHIHLISHLYEKVNRAHSAQH